MTGQMTGQVKGRTRLAWAAVSGDGGAPAVPGRFGWSVTTLLACATAMAALVLGGCGNYSNEDLEFMNALPASQDMAVEVPRQANLTTTGSAEGWQRAFQVTRDMNGVAAAFLSLIDQIRTSYPTGRDANTRIWGPFAAQDNPGWQVEFRMSKAGTVDPHFDYELVMIPPVGIALLGGGTSVQIIGGTFDAAGGVRLGTGHLVVTLDEARAAGLTLSGLESLRTLTIDYVNRSWPRTLTMTFENVDPPASSNDAISGMYAYTRDESGNGTMIFSFVSNLVPGPAGNETLLVDSRWLGSGPGREDLSIVAGDGIGATGTECWDQAFRSTYKVRSWAPADATGDASTCIPSQ